MQGHHDEIDRLMQKHIGHEPGTEDLLEQRARRGQDCTRTDETVTGTAESDGSGGEFNDTIAGKRPTYVGEGPRKWVSTSVITTLGKNGQFAKGDRVRIS